MQVTTSIRNLMLLQDHLLVQMRCFLPGICTISSHLIHWNSVFYVRILIVLKINLIVLLIAFLRSLGLRFESRSFNQLCLKEILIVLDLLL